MIDLETEIPVATIKCEEVYANDGDQCTYQILHHANDDFDYDTDNIIEEQYEDSIEDIKSTGYKEENLDDTAVEMDEDATYTCNYCNVDISNVEEHLREFHNNDEDFVCELEDSETANVSDEEGNELIKNEVFDEQSIDEYVELVDAIDQDATEISYMDTNGVLYVKKKPKVPITRINESQSNPTIAHMCEICNITFATLKIYNAHMMTHEQDDPLDSKDIDRFECAVCNTIFKTNKSLRLHVRMHGPVKSKSLSSTLTPASLSGNKTSPTVLSRNMFHCTICKKSFNKEFKEMHLLMHSDEPKFNCKICNRKFKNQQNLTMHMGIHQEVKSKVKQREEQNKNVLTPYECGYCDRQFARPHEKVKHERIHTGEKPYGCEICGKTFRVSYCLTLHMRTHENARPYVCPHCKKKFKAHSVYNHHLMTHSTERKYHCTFCTKSFKTCVQLAGHKNSHTKPFSCTECNRPFATLYAVRSHMETHKKANNNLHYKCQLCGAKYARTFALRDHLKEHHNITDPGDGTSLDALQAMNEQSAVTNASLLKASVQSILPQTNQSENEDELLAQDIGESEYVVGNEEIVTDWLK